MEMVPGDVAARGHQASWRSRRSASAPATECDAQVLVWQDMIGLRTGRMPRFVKQYADLHGVLLEAAQELRRRRGRRHVPGTRAHVLTDAWSAAAGATHRRVMPPNEIAATVTPAEERGSDAPMNHRLPQPSTEWHQPDRRWTITARQRTDEYEGEARHHAMPATPIKLPLVRDCIGLHSLQSRWTRRPLTTRGQRHAGCSLSHVIDAQRDTASTHFRISFTSRLDVAKIIRTGRSYQAHENVHRHERSAPRPGGIRACSKEGSAGKKAAARRLRQKAPARRRVAKKAAPTRRPSPRRYAAEAGRRSPPAKKTVAKKTARSEETASQEGSRRARRRSRRRPRREEDRRKKTTAAKKSVQPRGASREEDRREEGTGSKSQRQGGDCVPEGHGRQEDRGQEDRQPRGDVPRTCEAPADRGPRLSCDARDGQSSRSSSFQSGSLSHASLRSSTFPARGRPPPGRVGAEPVGVPAAVRALDRLVGQAEPVLRRQPCASSLRRVASAPVAKLHSTRDSDRCLATISPRRAVPDAHRAPRVRRPARPGAVHRAARCKDAETIERMRVAGRLAAQALAEVGAARRARASPPTSSTGSATSSSSTTAPTPRRSATAASRSRCAPASTRSSATASPTAAWSRTATSSTSTSPPTSAASTATPTRPSSPVTSTRRRRLLVERTEEALRRAIKAVRPGRRVNVIGRVIESYAKRFGYGVVREFTGHGIGTSFHSGLMIPHYDDPHYDDVIEAGMTFTIEPMLCLGTADWDMWDDGWTVTTKDKRAQRPVRAHPARHRRRRGDPHSSA